MTIKRSDIPRLDAYDIGDGVHWIVWCVHCLRWHFHGAGSGHRVAHCFSESPYDVTGYILVRRGHATDDILIDIDRSRPRGPGSALSLRKNRGGHT